MDTWKCTRCGRAVSNGIAVSFDPRFATGLCLHGSKVEGREPSRVALASDAVVENIMEERRYASAIKRAEVKIETGQKLSLAEKSAVARRDRERAEYA